VKITAVWDEQPERGEAWAKELGAAFEADLNVLLKRSDVDAVAVNTPTNLHAEVMTAAANAGKHIFTEKVMALSVEECEGIASAVRRAGVKFCISFPHRTLPQNLFAKKAVDEHLIGDVTLMRVRNAHNGATAGWLPPHFYDPVECGGGAMIDLGAHPMYLARWIMGKPVRITSLFNSYTGKPVEDNAVSIIEFENKGVAVVETGFVSSNSPFSLELYGTAGSLLIGGPDGKVSLISSKMDIPVKGWITPSSLPQALLSPVQQWVKGIQEGTEITFGLEEGIQLTELMEAAYISHKEKRQVEFR
jgi:predicted dehydrogenase